MAHRFLQTVSHHYVVKPYDSADFTEELGEKQGCPSTVWSSLPLFRHVADRLFISSSLWLIFNLFSLLLSAFSSQSIDNPLRGSHEADQRVEERVDFRGPVLAYGLHGTEFGKVSVRNPLMHACNIWCLSFSLLLFRPFARLSQ